MASHESLALKQRLGATREWPINNMAANMKDFCCRQPPNHLQNLHLLSHTFLTVKHHLMQKKTQSKSLGHFSRGKDIFGRPKFKKLKFRIVN